MEREIGFLVGEFEQAVAAREEGIEAGKVVEIDPARGHQVMRERDRRFHALLEALPTAIYTTDAAGRITYYNDAAVQLWGVRPQLGTSEWCGSWKLYWPDGKPLPHDECPMAIALKENRAVRGFEAAAERPDGTRVPFIPYPTPLHDAAGNLVGAVNMLVDITERKRAETEQNMLMRELHHRVRNTLAIAQAVIGSTAKSADTIESFKDALIGRIGALSRTNLLLSGGSRSLAFAVMLKNELEPFDDGGMRVVLRGPPVEISARQAVPIGMALHELTTNSSKYGALSVLGGRLEITWRLVEEADNKRRLEFDWVETGGPKTTWPHRRGFGLELLESVLPRQVMGATTIDFRPEGLRVRVSMPLLAEPASPPAKN